MKSRVLIVMLTFLAVAVPSAIAVATSCAIPIRAERATLTLLEREVDGEVVEVDPDSFSQTMLLESVHGDFPALHQSEPMPVGEAPAKAHDVRFSIPLKRVEEEATGVQ